jgi:4-alpha-glucanotransferase
MTSAAFTPRSSGILLHPTSLPGPFGIGDLGPVAYQWVDSLVRAKQTWWQILPLGPTGYGDSPYQCFSAFAGNANLISPQILVADGLLEARDLERAAFPASHVDFGPVIRYKHPLLLTAWDRFQTGQGAALRGDFERFVHAEAAWLEDYALFMAIKETQQDRSWQEWIEPAKMREPAYLKQAAGDLARSVGSHRFRQFLFFRQWQRLKTYANERHIQIIGDIPIFISGDSAEVWANQDLFTLYRDSRPEIVAVEPPDYFSATGQLWGNPHYNWSAMEKAGFAWWIARFRATLQMVDVVRLDHFRGFEAYWEIPAGSTTAVTGRWVKAPGEAMLHTLRAALGALPIIAEDLGVITPEVDALRHQFGLPGMRILQFAFDNGPANRFLPHNFDANTIVYTGTHDNDTTWGWYRTCAEHERDHVRRYLTRDGSDITWDLIRAGWSSVACCAIAPLQDLMNLGTEARMNFPGKPQGNWAWRFTENQLVPSILDRLAEMTDLYGRARMEEPAK